MRMFTASGRNTFACAIWLTLLCSFTTAAQTTSGLIELDITTAVQRALENNPGLAQMQSRYEAVLEVPSQAGTLPDPVINFNTMNFPVPDFNRKQENMTQVQLGIMQSFPFPGKLALKQEAAEHDARAAGYNVEELRVKLTASVRSTWWQIYYLDRALETVQRNQNLFREFIQVAAKKYETGVGLQQDVLLAQLELSRLLEQEILVESMHRNQAIQLNVLMDMPGRDDVALPIHVNQTLPTVLDKQAYFDLLETSRPLLKQKETEVRAAQARLDGAQRDYYPDFNVGVNYGDRRGDNPNGRSRDDFFSVMVGIKVPLYAHRKQRKAFNQRVNEKQSAIYASSDAKGQIQGAITTALTDYSRSLAQFALFKTSIVPQASQTVQSMLAGYQVSEVDFLNLVRAQMTLLNYELQYWRVFVEAKQSLARLEAAVGTENIYE